MSGIYGNSGEDWYFENQLNNYLDELEDVEDEECWCDACTGREEDAEEEDC